MRHPALELLGVSKRFGNVTALDDVSLVVAAGRVHALLGENGAGKTTLMRIAYGLLRPEAGEVRFFGQSARQHSVRDAIRAGAGMVHQHLSLVPNLTASENLVLGGRGVFSPREAEDLLERTAAASGLHVPSTALARDLTIVEQQRLEILKALARGVRLLILDEPTSGLAPAEIDDLLRWIRAFASSGGSVVLVTHKLREALAVADDVSVLRRGRLVHAGPARDSTEESLARAIFPETVDVGAQPIATEAGEPVVRGEAVDVIDRRGVRRLKGATFRIHRHEIVGIAAVEGSGHRELLGAIAGLQGIAAGSLELPARVALIPADRTREALIADFTLSENVALRGLGARKGLMPWKEIENRTAALLQRFAIVATSARARARTLSGGNQQRLVVGRELEHDVDLVVADNPTRGLDLRATAFVHVQFRAAAAKGAAVVFHSSDLDELLSLATRVFVVFHGAVREVENDRDIVARAMLGAETAA